MNCILEAINTSFTSNLYNDERNMEGILAAINTNWIAATIIAAFLFLIIWLVCNWIWPRKKVGIGLVDILMVVAFLATIILVIITACKQPTAGTFDLTVLTISMAFGTIIPYIVGISMARNEVTKIVDAKFKELENKYSISLYSLSKQNAHMKRMSANLLKDFGDTKPENKKWAVGWASEALISYSRIKHEHHYDAEKYINECIELLKNISPDDITCDKSEINERTLRSLLTMHAYTKLNDKRLYNQMINTFTDIMAVEQKLLTVSFKDRQTQHPQRYTTQLQYQEELCSSCRISDLDDEIVNEKIRKEIIKIIKTSI